MRNLPNFIVMLFIILCVGSSQSYTQTLEEVLSALPKAKFAEKEKLIDTLGSIEDAVAIDVLNAMSQGTLYYHKKTKQVLFTAKNDDGFEVVDVITGTNLGNLGKREVKRISLNNNLRKYIKNVIAKSSLMVDDPGERINAAEIIFKSNSPELYIVIQQAIANEENKRVLEKLKLTEARLGLLSDDRVVQSMSLDYFEKNNKTDPKIQSVINEYIQISDPNDGSEQIRLNLIKAEKIVSKIENNLRFFKLTENLFFGLSLGSILFLAAVGLAITFGVMGVINMAHGEMIMLGAYATYVVQLFLPNLINYSLFIAIPFAFLVAGAVGIILERGIIRYLYGRPLETLLATFGISLFLQQLVRSIFSPINMPVSNPTWMGGMLEVHPALSLSYGRIYILVFGLMVFLALWLILKKTHFGTEVRAVMQNRSMARAMGIKTGWIDSLTFGLGSGIAGIAGVALSQITNVGPNLGQGYIIDSFMVVVFGGVGNLWGTLTGAFMLGIGNKFLEPYAGAVVAKIFVLVFVILFIQRRPRGMFALKGRAAEVNQ